MRKDIKCLQEAHEPYEGSDKDQNDAGCGVWKRKTQSMRARSLHSR